MGYTTDFDGAFTVSPKLKPEDKEFLTKLNKTRRMARNVGPEYGVEGEFYVDGTGDFGQDRDATIIDFNTPPRTQPGLWCQWVPGEDGETIEWDGGEKFYNYTEWLAYIIAWLAPRGYVLNGSVDWQGEDSSDFGRILVESNQIKIQTGKKELSEPQAFTA